MLIGFWVTRQKNRGLKGWVAPLSLNLLLFQQLVNPLCTFSQAGGAGAAVSSQTRQDMQLRQQVKDADPMAGTRPVEEEAVTARPLSSDMGDVQIMTKKDHKPCFFFTVDTQAFYNSNVLYSSSIGSTFGAWQIITTPEIGFAPKIQDEQYSMFFPRVGFRYQFFTYAQAEPPKTDFYQTVGPSNLNFQISNPYASLGWSFSDDLYLEFSIQGNIYNGSGRDWSSYNNFLNEYPLAWQATWFQAFAEIHSVSITGRASYVFAISPAQSGSPSNNQFSRTDNNLTFSWSTTPMKELNTQMYASFRLAKYTGSGSDQIPGSTFSGGNNAFTESDRLDFQQTYGASVTWSPIEYLSVRAFVSWTKSDTSIPEPVTGQFEAYNAGTGLNLIYRF
jgi:hypothetical protein